MPFHHPSAGAIVTYLDNRADGDEMYHHAVALGPHLDDPHTDDTWVSVMRTDGTCTLVDPASVIDVLPDGDQSDHRWRPTEMVEMTQRALDTLSRGLAAPTTADMTNARAVLDDFVSTISPVQPTLDVLTEVEPTGTLAISVLHLVGASVYLDDGDIDAARAAIATAYMLIEGLGAA